MKNDHSVDITDPYTGEVYTIQVPHDYDEYNTTYSTTTTVDLGNGISAAGISSSWGTYIDEEWSSRNSGKLTVTGNKGKWDVEERIRIIERVLNIPERDYEMEQRHPELKEMFNKHMREVERVINQLPDSSEYEQEVEKHRMWDVLTGPDRNINGGP